MADQKTEKIKVALDTQALSRLIEGLQKVDEGLFNAVHALSDSECTDTRLYAELCRVRGEVDNIRDGLKPSVFL